MANQSYKEVYVKKIISIISTLALISFTSYVAASNELCLASGKDCTFVLLSATVTEKVIEIEGAAKHKINNFQNNHKVIQSSLLTEENTVLSLVNGSRAKQRFSPFSTFKVVNSLIGLDTQIIVDAKQVLTFDKEKFPVQKWWPPVWKLPVYNLSSAFKFSMVAIYRQLATEIGQKKMQSYLADFAYGNQDISSGIDSFWLNGSMKISAIEQVNFLHKMYQYQLSVKSKNIDVLKQVMLVESTDDYKLYAKTGAGRASDADKKNKSMLGWYVGFVENANGVHFFAFNLTRGSYAKMKASRVVIARNHLVKSGIIK